jgi:hypothetical protein
MPATAGASGHRGRRRGDAGSVQRFLAGPGEVRSSAGIAGVPLRSERISHQGDFRDRGSCQTILRRAGPIRKGLRRLQKSSVPADVCRMKQVGIAGRQLNWLLLTIGALTALLGAAVLAGWYGGHLWIIQPIPGSPPMMPLTALSLFGVGSALSIFVLGRRRVPIIVAASTGTLQILTLARKSRSAQRIGGRQHVFCRVTSQSGGRRET